MLDAHATSVGELSKSASGQDTSHMVPMAYGMATLGVIASIGLISLGHPFAALAIAAILWGFSEIDGLCGTSHLCTLSPLRALDATGSTWRRAAAAYLLGGIATSYFTGLLLGTIGLFISGYRSTTLITLAVAAAVLMGRELKFFWFRLPQVWRQTHKQWAFQFGMTPAAAMWGAHIGIGFATVIKHGGFYVLVGFAFLSEPPLAALLMSIYWFGRTLPILAAPLLTSDIGNAEKLVQTLTAANAAYRHVAAAGLLIAAAVAIDLARQ